MPKVSSAEPPNLEQLLRDPRLGRDLQPSMRGVKAICIALANRSDTSPHLIGALDLIAHTSDLAQVLAVVAGVAGRPENVGENEIGRAIGAARMILSDVATMGQRKIVLDEGAPQSVVASILEDLGAGFAKASSAERDALVSHAATLIAAKTGRWPQLATVERALAKATQRGAPKRVRQVEPLPRRATTKPQTDKREPSKRDVFYDLLRELGMAPTSKGAMKRTRQRQRRKRRQQ